MAVKGSATITLTQYRDTQSVTRYYKLVTAGSSAPSKPTTKPPSSDWSDSEPACDISKTLYFCDFTVFSNGEGEYSAVSKSSSYEAAKQAYNKAQNAQTAAGAAQSTADTAQSTADTAKANAATAQSTADTAKANAATAQTAAENAAKTATNFISYDSTNGLLVGNKESGSWSGYRTQTDNDSFNILDENGNIIALYGSNEVELGKGNSDAIIKMCDGKAYIKNYIVGSENTSVFCGQNTTAVGEWDGASESYAFFKQGYAYIGQSSSHIKFSSLYDNKNDIEIKGRTITMLNVSTIGNFDCYMKPRFFTMAGEIKMWAGDGIPDGWLLCDGSEVSKTDYPELYGAIGDLWGVPNSSSNFKLPNLAGNVPVGYNSADTDFDTVGKTGGEKTHTLTIKEMPAHTHSRNYYSSDWCANGSKSGYHGNDAGLKRVTGSTGGNGAHNNLQPYAVIKYIICAI